jgi:hypothetical protein
LFATLVLAAQGGALENAFRSLAWLPVTALLVEYALAKTVLARLSYFAILVPLLTCLFSLQCGRVWLVPQQDIEAMSGIVDMRRALGSSVGC